MAPIYTVPAIQYSISSNHGLINHGVTESTDNSGRPPLQSNLARLSRPLITQLFSICVVPTNIPRRQDVGRVQVEPHTRRLRTGHRGLWLGYLPQNVKHQRKGHNGHIYHYALGLAVHEKPLLASQASKSAQRLERPDTDTRKLLHQLHEGQQVANPFYFPAVPGFYDSISAASLEMMLVQGDQTLPLSKN